jgi:hypothetical protein
MTRDVLDDACVHHAAVEAVQRGWHVFPTRPGGKEPRQGLHWADVAVGSIEQLKRAQWRPGENYGVACKRSGLVVVDLDRPKPGYAYPPRWESWRDELGVVDGRDVLAVLAERHGGGCWPDTYTVHTPSGGAHLYYAAPAGRTIGNKPLGPMIDIRGGGDGNGGYVVGPGSILGGRRYEVIDGQDPAPLPGWIADLLDPPRPYLAAVPPPAARPGDRVAARLEGLIVAVLDARPGERNNVLHWAACRGAEMIAAGQLDDGQVSDSLAAAACRVGLDDGEARRTIASALRHTLRSSA